MLICQNVFQPMLLQMKRKLGFELARTKRKNRRKSRDLTFDIILRNTRLAIKGNKKSINLKSPAKLKNIVAKAIRATKKLIGSCRRRHHPLPSPRIIPVPHIDGVLPLILLLAGVSSLGTLAGGVGIV